jgi:hypothetical protein
MCGGATLTSLSLTGGSGSIRHNGMRIAAEIAVICRTTDPPIAHGFAVRALS